MRLKLDQIKGILGAEFHAASNAQNTEILAVCRDTNDVVASSLFVCIVGQRFDGHDFAAKAVEHGAKALLVSRYLPNIDVAQFVVADTVKALAKLALAWRKMFKGKVVAITGSAGKTTLKECLAHVLESANKQVARNKLNYNNQIGLPLSMLSASGNEDCWVMEAGISEPHDMDELGAMLLPDLALVLNVGAAHTEGLGAKGVAWHKSRLFKYLTLSDVANAFACADYAELVQNVEDICTNYCLFSGKNSSLATYKAIYRGMDDESNKGRYGLSFEQENYEILTPFYGSYGAENLAAIFAVAHALGLTSEEIICGISNINLPEHRFNMHEIAGWCVIDDTYNANALSMRRMIEAAVQKANDGPCYAVLGAMGELGYLAKKEHYELGSFLCKSNIQNIFWKGPHADDVQRGLKSCNYAGNFATVNSVEEFTKVWAKANLNAGTVLCKGSRSNKLEEFVAVILEQIKADV